MVDECLPMDFVTVLRARGHDVVWVREEYRQEPDEKILEIAMMQQRIVLTEDRDFGRLTILHQLPAVGIVLVQVSQLAGSIAEIAARVGEVISELGNTLHGCLTVIGPGRTRQRPL